MSNVITIKIKWKTIKKRSGYSLGSIQRILRKLRQDNDIISFRIVKNILYIDMYEDVKNDFINHIEQEEENEYQAEENSKYTELSLTKKPPEK